MKKKISLLIIITLILQLVLTAFNNIAYATSTNKTIDEKRNSESYWSKTNAPVFYGTTKITIKQGIIDEFNVLDSRFRIFARDFEDGDLTPKIKHSGQVNVNEVNNYEITYTVTDSHNNTTSLVVPVIVTDDENAKITVERTLYTTPSVWNMDLAEFSRCNYGDRQIFGVFLAENQSINARILSAETSLRIDFMNNDSHTESSTTLPTTGEWITVQNIKDNIGYDAVPLVRTPVLSKANTVINKTYKVELEYDETISPLNYYHYLDNEDTFRQEWTSSQNSYAVVESETLLLVVPFTDMKYMSNYYANGFSSIDKFLEYYQKVVEKMDEYVGLDFNPIKITDQNVRTKYVIKANVHGIGAAYYAGDHVGVNNASMGSFFEMNWGGLHELAHGYQGSLGKGEMLLGEVSNNILGYYIQTDKSIYDKPGNWLGELPVIEESRNAERLAGKTFLEIDEPSRLYVIINLLDSFEGGTTYAKMFSWYREQLNLGRTMTNQDAYVEATADIYNVNILPYMDAWGLNISNEVKATVYESNYPLINILADMTNQDGLNTIMVSEGINRKYSLLSNDVFQKYGITSTASLTIDIDNISVLNGKIVLLKDGENIINSYNITDFTLELMDIPIGTYYLQMPILNGYSQEHTYIQIKQDGLNTYTYTYENLKETTYDNYLKIQILGYNYDTIAYQLNFKDNYNKVEISYPNQSKMSGNEAVTIYNSEGSIVSKATTVGGYFDFDKGTHEIDLQPGYKIEITYPDKYATKVRAYNTLLNQIVPEYGAIGATTTYTVIDNGLIREDMNNEDADELAYISLKGYLTKIIDAYAATVTEKELTNKNINISGKATIINAYEQLRDADKVPYTELINAIKRGGSPKISLNATGLEFEVGTSVNLYSLIKATDNEDGPITISKNNTTLITDFNNKVPDTYDVTYKVKDSDNNISSFTLKIKIVDNSPPPITPPVTPPENGDNTDPVIPPTDDEENGEIQPPDDEDSKPALPPEDDDTNTDIPPDVEEDDEGNDTIPPENEETEDDDSDLLPPTDEDLPENDNSDVILPPNTDTDVDFPTSGNDKPSHNTNTSDEIIKPSIENNAQVSLVDDMKEELIVATAPVLTDEEDIVNTNIDEVVVPEAEPESENESEISEQAEHKDSDQTENINTNYQKVILLVVLIIGIIGIITFIIKRK